MMRAWTRIQTISTTPKAPISHGAGGVRITASDAAMS